jgi:hypothetical protein
MQIAMVMQTENNMNLTPTHQDENRLKMLDG